MHNDLDRIPIPEQLNDRIDEALKMVERNHKRKTMRKIFTCAGSVAAVFAAFFIFCAANPVLASKLPVVGYIFQKVETNVSYKGDYSKNASKLIDEEQINKNEEQNAMEETAKNPEEETSVESPYIQTSNGITISVSEVYYSSKALYLAMSIENKEPFPDDFNKKEYMEDYILDYNRLEMMTQGSIEFDGEQYELNPYYIEGDFENPNKFVGIVRVDIDHLFYYPSQEEIKAAGISSESLWEEGISDEEAVRRSDEYNLKVKEAFPDVDKKIELPETFTYHLQVDRIWSDLFETKPVEATDPEGNIVTLQEPTRKEYEGSWEFDFDVALDTSKTQTVEIQDTNENGEGFASVEKTPYEISAEPIIPQDKMGYDYFIAICDANGDLLDYQGEFADTYQTYGRDIDTIYVYLCDANEYLDELKGYYWAEDYQEKRKTKTFAQYLDEHALYGTKIEFTE